MTLEQAQNASDYSEATIVVNNIRYSVDADSIITSGVDGMPVSIIESLPETVAKSDHWEPVGEADA